MFSTVLVLYAFFSLHHDPCIGEKAVNHKHRPEAVTRRCSVRKVFPVLKISQNSQEKRDSGTGVYL